MVESLKVMEIYRNIVTVQMIVLVLIVILFLIAIFLPNSNKFKVILSRISYISFIVVLALVCFTTYKSNKFSESVVMDNSLVLVTSEKEEISQSDYFSNFNGRIHKDLPPETIFYKETPVLNRQHLQSKHFGYVGPTFLNDFYKVRYYYELPNQETN